MALITRLSRLFTADFHAVLDRIEEPEIQLRQAIREMEESCARCEQRLKSLAVEHKQLDAHRTELQARLEQTADEMDVCFASGNEDLARGLIKRKLETERRERAASTRLAETTLAMEEIGSALESNSRELDLMRRKAAVFVDRAGESGEYRTGANHWFDPDVSVGDDEVEVAFLREKQRRTGS